MKKLEEAPIQDNNGIISWDINKIRRLLNDDFRKLTNIAKEPMYCVIGDIIVVFTGEKSSRVGTIVKYSESRGHLWYHFQGVFPDGICNLCLDFKEVTHAEHRMRPKWRITLCSKCSIILQSTKPNGAGRRISDWVTWTLCDNSILITHRLKPKSTRITFRIIEPGWKLDLAGSKNNIWKQKKCICGKCVHGVFKKMKEPDYIKCIEHIAVANLEKLWLLRELLAGCDVEIPRDVANYLIRLTFSTRLTN